MKTQNNFTNFLQKEEEKMYGFILNILYYVIICMTKAIVLYSSTVVASLFKCKWDAKTTQI